MPTVGAGGVWRIQEEALSAGWGRGVALGPKRISFLVPWDNACSPQPSSLESRIQNFVSLVKVQGSFTTLAGRTEESRLTDEGTFLSNHPSLIQK